MRMNALKQLTIPMLLALVSLTSCATAKSPVSEMSCLDRLEPTALRVEPHNGIKAPIPIQRQEPIVSKLLRHGAMATLEAVIGENGVPRNICLSEGDREWGLAMIEAFKQWRFEPATLDGRPVAVRFTLTTEYTPGR